MAIVSTIATFLSIIGVFTEATNYPGKLFSRRKKLAAKEQIEMKRYINAKKIMVFHTQNA